jgi:acylphosphatase
MELSRHASIRRRVVYHGRVQGVGFRYTTVALARRFPVAGYVRNLSDGTVELVVQAACQPMQEFLDEIERYFESNISHVSSQDEPADEPLRGFTIRH